MKSIGMNAEFRPASRRASGGLPAAAGSCLGKRGITNDDRTIRRRTQGESLAGRMRRSCRPRQEGTPLRGWRCDLRQADAPPMMPSRLARLGGKLWQGDISRGANRQSVQDARVRGIQPEAYSLAIRLVGAKRRRAMSPAQRKVLEMARLASPLTSIRTVQDGILRA
jgi:hypothetical protein